MAKNVIKKFQHLFSASEIFWCKSICQLTHGGAQSINDATRTRAPEREKQGSFLFSLRVKPLFPKVALLSYNKRPLTLPEQVAHLQTKGLVIGDPIHAQAVLARVGLYRFKGYLLPYKSSGGYGSSVTFSDIEALMDLDEALRVHIFRAMPLVEVGIRQAINQYMVERAGVRWYARAELFSAPTAYFDHAQFLAKALSEFHGMPDLFVGHYREKYNPSEPPPAWMIAETMTLGSWSKLFEALADRQYRNDVADTLGLSGKTLTSWLHALTVIRNICAHHSRLYDRVLSNMGVAEDRRLKKRLSDHSFDPRDAQALRLAPRLYALHRLTRALDPQSSWTADLKTLLASVSPDVLARIGLRPGWETQPEWA